MINDHLWNYAEYPKIEAEAKLVAEELGIDYAWNDILFGDARIRCSSYSAEQPIVAEAGVKQAERCRQALANMHFDQCFASPISCAKTTAEVLWQGREEPLVFLDSLKEAHLFFYFRLSRILAFAVLLIKADIFMKHISKCHIYDLCQHSQQLFLCFRFSGQSKPLYTIQ
ncbi:Histidine phosphatase superfamily, clade-1 [Corchorus capsularis]|uniref:Histidine phosphatase superfamily, clade-1 n=1 Tax=Corchorus capsularis TaxID=210143 RepID=A0A1R3GC38_COCAP|nr:Histidine phosphatase superfamily, clade-1 [Corchorus capsularis]